MTVSLMSAPRRDGDCASDALVADMSACGSLSVESEMSCGRGYTLTTEWLVVIVVMSEVPTDVYCVGVVLWLAEGSPAEAAGVDVMTGLLVVDVFFGEVVEVEWCDQLLAGECILRVPPGL